MLRGSGLLNRRHGERAFSILLFQDLATLPFLVLAGAGDIKDFSALTLLRQLPEEEGA